MLCVRSDFLQPCSGAVGAGEEMRDAVFSYGTFGPTPCCIKSLSAPSLSFAFEPEGSFREGTLVVYIGGEIFGNSGSHRHLIQGRD